MTRIQPQSQIRDNKHFSREYPLALRVSAPQQVNDSRFSCQVVALQISPQVGHNSVELGFDQSVVLFIDSSQLLLSALVNQPSLLRKTNKTKDNPFNNKSNLNVVTFLFSRGCELKARPT